MGLTVKNSRDLLQELRLKFLVYAPPGFGKTTFAASAPNVGIIACETGHGKGLISVAEKGIPYVEPESYEDFATAVSGAIFKEQESIAVDSLSEMTRTFIKDYAIKYVTRKSGNSEKRDLGIPELDDYMAMAELTRRLLRRLLDLPKHVIVTATEAPYDPPVMDMNNPSRNRGERLGGPDLAGAMRLAAPAMFDVTLRGVMKAKLRDPKDPKSRYLERYWITELDEKHAGKNRIVVGGKSVFPAEVLYSPAENKGTFPWFLNQVVTAQQAQGENH